MPFLGKLRDKLRLPTPLGIGLATLCLAGLVTAAYFGWRKYTERSFAESCYAAREQQDWRLLGETADQWVKWDPLSAKGWLFAAEAAQGLD